MTSPIYRQNDSRFRKLAYPGKGYNMGSSGCGNCAVNHAVMEQLKYATFTPKDTRPFMVKYATYGQGTKWVGITAGLKHYGYDVYQPNIDSSMSKAWDALNKGKKHGILLLRHNKKIEAKRNICWTSSGHYVYFQNYKKIGKKHYFKIKDSGHRHHDGWYCYETRMAGLLRHIWISNKILPPIKNISPYKAEFPEHPIKHGSTGEDVRRWQKFLNHVYGEIPKNNPLKVDGKFGFKTDALTGNFQDEVNIEEDSLVGPTTIKYAKRWGV